MPSEKGKLTAFRTDPTRAQILQNIDYLAEYNKDPTNRPRLVTQPPSPARISWRDKDLGIFSLSYILSPFGTVNSYLPCCLVDADGERKSLVRNLEQQDDDPVVAGATIEGGTTGIFLDKVLEMKVLITLVPAAPNNKHQYHQESVEADDISDFWKYKFGIRDGDGPELDVFVPPGEQTARFAWSIDEGCEKTINELLALGEDDPRKAGIKPDKKTGEINLDGYHFTNYEREIKAHSKAMAAELLSAYADNIQGTLSTKLPPKQGEGGNVDRLSGNMTSATIQVAGYPSGKVSTFYEFPGQQPVISRMSLLPDEARRLILRVIPFTGSGGGGNQ